MAEKTPKKKSWIKHTLLATVVLVAGLGGIGWTMQDELLTRYHLWNLSGESLLNVESGKSLHFLQVNTGERGIPQLIDALASVEPMREYDNRVVGDCAALLLISKRIFTEEELVFLAGHSEVMEEGYEPFAGRTPFQDVVFRMNASEREQFSSDVKQAWSAR